MNPLRSVGGKLALALAVLVAGALGAVYVILVPSLEQRLVENRFDQMERTAPLVAQIPDIVYWDEWVRSAAQTTNSRVIIYAPLDEALRTALVLQDSSPNSEGIATDPIALRALVEERIVRGTVVRDGERFAQIAFPSARPVEEPYYILLAASLEEAYQTSGLVARRLLVAGGIGLGAAIAVGLLGARIFARRIRRLEQAAERIAGGRFDEPVVDPGRDELGDLAAAFEQMRGRLAHLDRVRREFIANASHELRTPVFSLGGFLELLADEELDDETRKEFTRTAQEQVERLGKLAIDLLDLSRLDAGRLQVERGTVDLAELAGDLAEEFRAVAAAGEHRLEAWAADDVTAFADEQRVFQIGRILVENALVHTPAGTRVRVAAAARNGSAHLSVEDDGPGIDPEQAAHVFERFYRGDGTQASGSGLGLAIARELAELMGGSVALEAGGGRTRFTLSLPAS